jgi:hypothetical protein
MKCLKCNNDLLKYQKKFCSRSCAGTYNGAAFPKRSKDKEKRPTCRNCTNKVAHSGATYCRECINNKVHYHGAGPVDKQTIEFASRRGGANRYDSIRSHARGVFKELLANPCCEKCSYNKHVELCHIKPISSFPKDTLVAEVNHRSNVMFLCPNCHWEFDHS